jgi:hypothetical protein
MEMEMEKFSFIVKFDFDNGEEIDREYPEIEDFETEIDMQKNLREQIANLICERRGVKNCPVNILSVHDIEHIDDGGQTSDRCWETRWFKKCLGDLKK